MALKFGWTARIARILGLALGISLAVTAHANGGAAVSERLVFTHVHVFDGQNTTLSGLTSVVVEGNRIVSVGGQVPAGGTTIDGRGYTLMPGLIDAHAHLMFIGARPSDLLTGDAGYLNVVAVRSAEQMLMRGFTSVRDLGGSVFGLKRGIDSGVVVGPRIWPSGAAISQSGGHGDYRLSVDLPAMPGQVTFTERIGAAAIADGVDKVLLKSREQLALGASQIKVTAGGGIGSHFDPIDVTQYTTEELRAAVQSAENWGTYVTVHAYTPKAVRQAIDAGVRCIEHGQLLDEATIRLMAEKGIWWSLQPFIDPTDSNFPIGSDSQIKELAVFAGTDNAYRLAKKLKMKVAWGADLLLNPEGAVKQNEVLSRMQRWYTPAEVLKMATGDNAELLALAGPRNPYPAPVGVVRPGALADLLLVTGDPTQDLKLIEDPARNFVVIMKDGKIVKNALSP